MKTIASIYLTAMRASVEASRVIMEIYASDFEKVIKQDGSPVTEADLASSRTIQSILKSTSIPIIGEELEKAPYSERVNWKETWIVDPLDGTKEFIKKNGEFSVNIAHVVDGRAVFGIIACPVDQTILVGGEGIGSFIVPFDSLNETERWITLEPKPINNPIVLAGSRTHYSGSIATIIESIELKFGSLKLLRKGSALKFFDLAKGEADIYPRYAPTMEWDIAAGQAILEALGGSVLDTENWEPLRYNKEDLYNPYFVAKTKAFSLVYA